MDHGSVYLLVLIGITSFVLSFIGATVGLVLGHLRLPLLIRYLGTPAGAAMNLIISGTGALAGAYRHARDGRVSWVGLALMGIPSGVGAIIAVLIFVQINPFWSYMVIGCVLALSGINMIQKKPNAPPPGDVSLIRRVIIEIIIGLALGALAAITGLMLGSLRLPMMIRYLRMDPKEAVGTNMAVGCMTGLVGAVTAFAAGAGKLNFVVLAAVIPPTLLGGYLGGALTGRFSKETVQRLAGWIIAFTGVVMVGQGTELYYRRPITYVPSAVVDENESSEYEEFFELERAEPEEADTTNPTDDPEDMLPGA